MLDTALYMNPVGVHFQEKTAYLYNRLGSATVAGRVYQMDLERSATETTGYAGTGGDSIFGNLVNSTVLGGQSGITVIALEAKEDNELVKVGLVGIFPVFVGGTNAAAVTDPLHALNSTGLNSDASAGARVVGYPMVATASGTSELVDVWFCGVGGGFGTK